jgi:hypothetical protein
MACRRGWAASDTSTVTCGWGRAGARRRAEAA